MTNCKKNLRVVESPGKTGRPRTPARRAASRSNGSQRSGPVTPGGLGALRYGWTARQLYPGNHQLTPGADLRHPGDGRLMNYYCQLAIAAIKPRNPQEVELCGVYASQMLDLVRIRRAIDAQMLLAVGHFINPVGPVEEIARAHGLLVRAKEDWDAGRPFGFTRDEASTIVNELRSVVQGGLYVGSQWMTGTYDEGGETGNEEAAGDADQGEEEEETEEEEEEEEGEASSPFQAFLIRSTMRVASGDPPGTVREEMCEQLTLDHEPGEAVFMGEAPPAGMLKKFLPELLTRTISHLEEQGQEAFQMTPINQGYAFSDQERADQLKDLELLHRLETFRLRNIRQTLALLEDLRKMSDKEDADDR